MSANAPPLTDDQEHVDSFRAIGLLAFTTTRAVGSFALHSTESASSVFGRWSALSEQVRPHAQRLACAHQVHGDRVIVHREGWEGWLRERDADGHFSAHSGTAMAVTIADCVPVFVAHESGAAAIVHSGWRGTELAIVRRAIAAFRTIGLLPAELRVHCGPSICGACYEVSPDVYFRLTSQRVERPTAVDLRAIIAQQAADEGVRDISIASSCTRCNNYRFFSHRCGDEGRQLAVICAMHRDSNA